MPAQYWKQIEENMYSTPVRQGSLRLVCFTTTYVLQFMPDDSVKNNVHGGSVYYDPRMKRIISQSANGIFLETSKQAKEALGLPENVREGLVGILDSIERDEILYPSRK